MSSSGSQGDRSKSDSDSKKPQRLDESEKNHFLSNVASSASGLLNSITSPPPSLATSGLGAAVASSSKSGQQQSSSSGSATGSSAWADTAGPSSYPAASSSSATYSDFRSEPHDRSLAPAAEGDFTRFSSASNNPFESPHPPESHSHPADGSDVAALLSFPMATSEIYRDDLIESVNTSHPLVVAFAECEDPVEFLHAKPEWTNYTDSVWGDLLELMNDAQEEVKGKGKGMEQEGRAVERLKQVWGQLRAKL